MRRFRPNHPTHVSDLFAYLQQEVDPADYPRLLAGRDPAALSDDEYYEIVDAVEAMEARRGGWDCADPAYRMFQDAVIPPWPARAIHFTAKEFSRFDRGSPHRHLHYTVDCGPLITQHDSPSSSVPLAEVAWGFAFDAADSSASIEAGADKYARGRSGHFVCFSTNEYLKAYAKHDREWQVIFVVGSEYDVARGSWWWAGSRRWVELEDGRTFGSFKDAANAPRHSKS